MVIVPWQQEVIFFFISTRSNFLFLIYCNYACALPSRRCVDDENALTSVLWQLSTFQINT